MDWTSRQVGFPRARLRPSGLLRIQITRTGKVSGFDFDPRDRGDLGASAMDLDVAIARLIGNGPATRRLPRALSWDGEDLLPARSAHRRGNAPPLLRRQHTGALVADETAIRGYQAFADDTGAPAELLARPVARWRDELTPGKQLSTAWTLLKHEVMSAEPAAKQARRDLKIVVLQMDDSPQAFEASLRHAAQSIERWRGVLWLQVDREGGSRIVTGEGLTRPTTPGDEIQLVVVGQGSTDDAQSRRLSGYNGRQLSERIDQALRRHLDGPAAPARKVTLLACDLESPYARRRFVEDFVDHFQPGATYEVTTFRGRVLFSAEDPADPALTRRWTLGFGDSQALNRAKDGVFVTRVLSDPVGRAGDTVAKYAGNTRPDRLSEAETIAALESALDVDPQAAAERAANRLTPRQRALEARRVRLVLEVLGQLRPEELLRFQRDRGERAFAMSDAVLAQLSMVFGSTDEVAAAQLRRVADHITQGLLSDPARLLDAYELLGHLSPRDRASVASRGWQARAQTSPHIARTLTEIAGGTSSITTASALFIHALIAARDGLIGGNRTGTESTNRIYGRTILFIAAVGAAASDSALYIDLSPPRRAPTDRRRGTSISCAPARRFVICGTSARCRRSSPCPSMPRTRRRARSRRDGESRTSSISVPTAIWPRSPSPSRPRRSRTR
ncbi:C80 family cysteine peptidase [Roseateles sp. UC29_93]|uniref:C80 family cysteine peptidase n=1 Tax=Roseateles sp. UC29_93 TaxID=3350177 RepID=UPI0036729DCC